MAHDLLGGEVGARFSVTFRHRGKARTLDVREVTAQDEDAVDRAMPYPPCPRKKRDDGTEYSDLADVAWRLACNAVERDRRLALIPIVSGACAHDAAGIRAAFAALTARYRREQLETIIAQVTAATELTEQDVEQEGEKLTPTGGTPALSIPGVPSEG